MPTNVAAEVRKFNRSYTSRIGVLEESFLGSGRPLGPSRLLFEIGPDGSDVARLRAVLGLDSGYLSRMLRGLEDEGLVVVSVSPTDRRRRVAVLTDAGRAEWHRLDRESQRAADSLVAPLADRQQLQLAEALRTARRLIAAATVRFVVAHPRDDDAAAAVASYFRELDARFPGGFDAGATDDDDVESMCPPHGAFLVGYSDGQAIACGGLRTIEPEVAEIKRMWVDPSWRGLGLAKRLLDGLERRAASMGCARVVLDTNGALVEAIALYESSGYVPVERYNDNPYAERWFEKDLRAG